LFIPSLPIIFRACKINHLTLCVNVMEKSLLGGQVTCSLPTRLPFVI
jgi:hypothetical protein